ncbi:MAG TPA: TetR/AcrR family transcriptional regulator [Thermoanaerobaculia bacterium]|nr:TetR/AcrR family transcriptional regulator [Thermoanaerobaculia bacterium]
MRYPAEHKQETRKRIVRAAARRFRSRGSEGTGIADLMRDLRLTHGGFYRHFGSKEDLLIEAFEQDEMHNRLRTAIKNARPGGELKALIDTYLSAEHCDDIGGGCPVAALSTELARRPPNSRARLAFERILKERTSKIATFIPGATKEEREAKARMLMSGMSGTLTVARVITDEQKKRRFLDGARKFYFDSVSR